MAQLDFPLNPTVGQVYAAGEGAWSWDGVKWESAYSAQLYLPLTGGSLAGPGNLSVGGTLNVTGATALGVLTTNGPVTTQGSNAGFVFLGRDTGQPWTWYAQSGVARLGYGGTDIVTVGTGGALHAASTFSAGGDISTPGNVLGANSVQSSGVYFQNNGGAFYSPQSITSNGNLTANGGVVYIAGMYWQNNAGYMYTPWPIHTDNYINIAGLLWQNSGGNMYTPSQLLSNSNVIAQGAVYAGGGGGVYFQNNGGWFYTPQGVWCANINTTTVQCNGNWVYAAGVNFGQSAIQGNGGYCYSPQWCQFAGNDIYLQAWGVITNALVGNQHAWWYTGGYIYWYLDGSQLGPLGWNGCDARLKENFAPIRRDCLATINKIALQSFDWPERVPERKRRRHDQGPEVEPEALPLTTTHWEVGYTAQQIREVMPEAISVPPALPDGEEGYLGVDLRMLCAHLIGAVQQLTRRLEAVEK